MKKTAFRLMFFGFAAFAACNSVQKSVDPTGQSPIPRGSGRNIDEDTLKAPGSDTSRVSVPDSLKN
ncbi:hypothetical protein [Arcticibacter tournemirensis]|uniref:Lipoprotein n=1 Tax=Arcticibacter tournemirensis TaxID=699437 RepID=A0A4Q0MFC2_9SPHI|nr:hypothetical protein [Arcticibacter tournemirensis]KAA8481396.1 hypothetical protein F1649_14870 [Arcticibacter tournemirensis]RXF71596.1 hypothetical protein EKH83_02605 [Arcticibacter tournemirensis]